MIDALIPNGVCWHCDEARADQNYWICKGCWVSVRRVGSQDSSSQTTALYRYEGAVETLLTRAKHPLEPAVYSLLLDTDFSMPRDAVYIPVPTPWHRRVRRRGCQTSCIAQLLVKRFGGQIVHALKRSHHHRRQALLDGESRRRLPSNAFKLRRSVSGHEQLVLVDDVMTTGTTLERAQDVLGVESIQRFVLGRVF